MNGRDCYEQATCGTSWYLTGKNVGLEGPHRKLASRARRMAGGYARMYGREWPLEQADLLDGLEAYKALLDGSLWDEAACTELGYSSTGDAARHAVEHAGLQDLEDPSDTIEAWQVGGRFYWGKRNGIPWNSHGVHEATARRKASEFAVRFALPWPIQPKRHRHIGPKAYALRLQANTWSDIAAAVGASAPHSHREARLHAQANGLPWPVRLPKRQPLTDAELLPKGPGAYKLRSQGYSWPHIGKELGIWARLAMKAAGMHARAKGLRWPIILDFDEDLGRKAYQLRVSSMQGWSWVGEQLGTTKGVVFDRAKKWAHQTGTHWPPQDIIPSTGQRAYELRAQKHMTWPQISEQIGKVSDFCGKEAKKWALANGLPWPLVPSTTTTPELKRLKTGEEAHTRRSAGATWVALAKDMGISKAWAVRTARDYAQRTGKPWPVVLFDEDVNRASYNLRIEGNSWEEVAERQGVVESTAIDRARKHAQASGEPWPTRVAPVRRGHSTNAQRAYELGYLERVPWKEVAELLGYSVGQSALNSAKVYAQRFNLPYHEQKRRGGSGTPPDFAGATS